MVLVVSRAMRSKNHHSSSSSSSKKEEEEKTSHKILYTFNFQFSIFKKKAKVVDKVGKE